MSLNLLSLLGVFEKFLGLREDFLNLADFHVYVLFVKSSDYHFWGQFGSSDFQKWMVVFFCFLAFFTEIKIRTDSAFVSDSGDVCFLTSVTDDSKMFNNGLLRKLDLSRVIRVIESAFFFLVTFFK